VVVVQVAGLFGVGEEPGHAVVGEEPAEVLGPLGELPHRGHVISPSLVSAFARSASSFARICFNSSASCLTKYSSSFRLG
jgi:hypothetical protein